MAMGWRQGRWAGGLVRRWEVGEANWEVCNPSTVASPRGLRLNICGLQGALPATFRNTPIRTAPVEHARGQVFTISDCSITSRSCTDVHGYPLISLDTRDYSQVYEDMHEFLLISMHIHRCLRGSLNIP